MNMNLASPAALSVANRHQEMRAAYLADPNPDYGKRMDRLKRLEKALLAYEGRLIEAMQSDFSFRSINECRNFDITTSLGELHFAMKNLKRWLRPRRYRMPIHLLPARARGIPQPKGVVAIISPWNYPVYLTMSPIVPALAAGNRVILKPSEVSPNTSNVLRDMLTECFDPLEISVFTGGADVASAVTEQPFDHIFFTGSTQVGRIVAEAAARNLVPVTLELGGKSPCIVGDSADLDRAARRITFGKGVNAGQTCVAPDYVLVPRQKTAAFVAAAEKWMRHFYPTFDGNPDYSAIISDRHRDRLNKLVKDAEAGGARVVRLAPTGQSQRRTEPPVFVIDPPADSAIMREEIFGPVLPIVSYDGAEEARAFVMTRDRPLAMYVFAESASERDFWLNQTIAGGVCVNEVMFHVAADSMPFGGIGKSGIGSYHGEDGFTTFSHIKSVLYQPKFNGAFMLEPPMTGLKARMADIFRKLV